MKKQVEVTIDVQAALEAGNNGPTAMYEYLRSQLPEDAPQVAVLILMRDLLQRHVAPSPVIDSSIEALGRLIDGEDPDVVAMTWNRASFH
jgi:hypothetical protein